MGSGANPSMRPQATAHSQETWPPGAGRDGEWRQHHAAVALLLTDIIMPDGIYGGQLAKQLQAEKPELKVIYMSGYPGDVAGRGGLDLHEGENFLQKPFSSTTLLQTIRQRIDQAK